MKEPLLAIAFVAGCASEIDAITIEPADSTVEVLNGAIVTSMFHAVAHRDDGTTAPLDGVLWTISDPRLGAIDDAGVYTPTGGLGGVVEIGAESGDRRGTTSLIVKLHFVDGAGPVDPAARDALVHASVGLAEQPASQDPAIAWAYPYDGTVFPRGLDAPDLMWAGGVVTDWYYVHIASTTFELEAFNELVSSPNPVRAHYAMSSARWTQLAESSSGDVDVAISRLAGGSATGVIHHHWTIAPARLPGTIYYWTALTQAGTRDGEMKALDLGAHASVPFLADYRPTGTEGCPKCHTPSADGRHMVLIMGNPFPTEESVDYDLVTGTARFVGYPADGGWGGAALSPHGDVVVPSFAGIRGRLGIATTPGAFDPITAASIANSGLETTRAWMPAFSPDGLLLVYVAEVPTPGGCQFGSGGGATDGALLKACSADLRAVDWDPVARHATHDRLLIAKGGDPARDVLQYPTPAPDHSFVIYGRGPEIGTFSHITPSMLNAGTLLGARPDSPDIEVELAQLGGRDYPFAAGARDRQLDYEASFAPVTAGGYAWVVFVSRRSYGNLLTGSPFLGEATGGVKQLWIAAIDLDAPPGTDPSHPAFWLPGQDMSVTDVRVVNQRARWTLSPCLGDDCIALP